MMSTKPFALVVDTIGGEAEIIGRQLRSDGFEVENAETSAKALAVLRRRAPHLLFTRHDPPQFDMNQFLGTSDFEPEKTDLVVLVRTPSTEDVVELMQRGAKSVIESPIFTSQLIPISKRTLARLQKTPAIVEHTPIDELARPAIVGQSSAVRTLLESLKLVTQAGKATVLIEGESGTGKELIARAVHYDGPRATRPFMAVNCATLTENLLEAELFGYEKGSFTGALVSGKKGLFDAASGGTLFLDEIGELAPGLQAKLLRVLQENAYKRVGGVVDVPTDVRIICATNRDLRQEVQKGCFRADLFYRINVVPIRVPPLRERRSDIPELALHFLLKFARDLNKQVVGLSIKAQEKLLGYSWPGNVRELRNVCEYAAIVCDGEVIETRHLVLPEAPTGSVSSDALPLRDLSLRGMETELIRVVLNETQYNISRAASLLGINRSTLYNKMRDYGLNQKDRPILRQGVS